VSGPAIDRVADWELIVVLIVKLIALGMGVQREIATQDKG
jgi:hypothetical protein